MKKLLTKCIAFPLSFVLGGCSLMGSDYKKTVDQVDIQKFMGNWYVIAGRFTFLEDGAFNPTETYTWNEKEKRIDIMFTYNDGAFNGKVKRVGQKGWIENKETNAYWQVSPFWPLKFDYLVLALAPDYSWTAIGVPNQKYLWIMARKKKLSTEVIQQILNELEEKGYRIDELEYPPQA